jgi:hypothetical protein
MAVAAISRTESRSDKFPLTALSLSKPPDPLHTVIANVVREVCSYAKQEAPYIVTLGSYPADTIVLMILIPHALKSTVIFNE